MMMHSARTQVEVCAAMYSTVSRRTLTQYAADAKIICYRDLLQHAAQTELLYSMVHPSTYHDAACYNVAVCQGTAPGA